MSWHSDRHFKEMAALGDAVVQARDDGYGLTIRNVDATLPLAELRGYVGYWGAVAKVALQDITESTGQLAVVYHLRADAVRAGVACHHAWHYGTRWEVSFRFPLSEEEYRPYKAAGEALAAAAALGSEPPAKRPRFCPLNNPRPVPRPVEAPRDAAAAACMPHHHRNDPSVIDVDEEDRHTAAAAALHVFYSRAERKARAQTSGVVTVDCDADGDEDDVIDCDACSTPDSNAGGGAPRAPPDGDGGVKAKEECGENDPSAGFFNSDDGPAAPVGWQPLSLVPQLTHTTAADDGGSAEEPML